jgi:hypothetical protein
MFNLLLVLLSISLTAATLYASMNYLPGTTSLTGDTYNLTRYGFVALDKAFDAVTTRASGYPPAPTTEADGGLGTHFGLDYGFLPKAPKGYAWKYGFNGADYYFCMYPATAGASQALWKGFVRARNVFSDQQYFIVPGAAASCDTSSPQSSNITTAPGTYPATVSVIYLLRWVPPPAPAETEPSGTPKSPPEGSTNPPPDEGTVDGQPVTQPSDA